MKILFPVIVTLSLLFVGCGSREPAIEPLPPSETFTWTDQPISLSPPPAEWERQREQSGGLLGVRFIKKGEVIGVAEHVAVGRRDRCAELGEMLRKLDDYDRLEFNHAVQRARPFGNDSFSGHEAGLAREAERSLDWAVQAFGRGDTGQARSAIQTALKRLQHVRYKIDDVLVEALRQPHKERGLEITVGEPKSMQLAGEDAYAVDFNVRSTHADETFVGHEVYVVKNNRLFVISFQGREANRFLFHRILGTISFPQGACEH